MYWLGYYLATIDFAFEMSQIILNKTNMPVLFKIICGISNAYRNLTIAHKICEMHKKYAFHGFYVMFGN